MQLRHEQAHQYRTEMLDFKKLTSEAMTGIKNDHSMMFKDLKGASARVDLVEREMDYVETQNSPRACATKAEKVLEQEAWGLQERDEVEEEEDWEELQSRVSGEFEEVCSYFSQTTSRDIQSFKFIHGKKPRRVKTHDFYRSCSLYYPHYTSHRHHIKHFTRLLSWKSYASGKQGDKHSTITNASESVWSHVSQPKCGHMQVIHFCTNTLLFEEGIHHHNPQIQKCATSQLLQ